MPPANYRQQGNKTTRLLIVASYYLASRELIDSYIGESKRYANLMVIPTYTKYYSDIYALPNWLTLPTTMLHELVKQHQPNGNTTELIRKKINKKIKK